jgi:hypothetical protein
MPENDLFSPFSGEIRFLIFSSFDSWYFSRLIAPVTGGSA